MSQSSKWAKCYCGSESPLFFMDTKSKHKDKTINVYGVPTYYCNVCEDAFMDGKVSSKYKQLVSEALEQDKEEIWYDEEFVFRKL